MKKLTILRIGYNGIDSEGAKYISNKLKELTELNISENSIEYEGVQYISQLKHLTFLDVSNCNNLKQLTNLRIDSNNIGSKGVEYITKLIKLKYLCFGCNNIGNEGAKLIGSTMKQLEYLHICNIHIDSQVASSLYEALPNTNIIWYESVE